MINHIRGILEESKLDFAVIDVSGIGYKIFVPVSTIEKLPEIGDELKLFIFESTSMYGGNKTLYGFISESERDAFMLLKEHVPGAGAKKALDYLDKVTKSLPDFKKYVLNKDVSSIVKMFGFTKKTAEKLISALKEKIGEITISGKEKWDHVSPQSSSSQAIEGLVSLGYKEVHSREAVEKVIAHDPGSISVEETIKRALRYI